MKYTIGEVAEKTGLSAHTLRYYEKVGVLNSIGRSANGIREFSDNDIELLKIVNCLKETGISINEIKNYIELCSQGKNSIEERKKIFEERKKHIEQEIENLNRHLETVKYKIWYYDNIEELGNEEDPLNCDKMRNIYMDKNK